MNKLLQIIEEQMKLLEQSKISLQYSFIASKKLIDNNVHEQFSLAQQDVFEAFASRLARTADILVQKVLKTIQLYESEPVNTVRDMLLQAEKKNLIEGAEIMFELRLFRNEIAHDYLPKSQIAIIEACIYFTPFLITNVDRTLVYCKKNLCIL